MEPNREGVKALLNLQAEARNKRYPFYEEQSKSDRSRPPKPESESEGIRAELGFLPVS